MEILIEEKLAEENEFLPGLTCASIYEIKDKKKSKRVEPTDAVNNAIEAVNLLKSKVSLYQVEDVNPVIRALGRRRLVTPIFELLDCMRAAGKYVSYKYTCTVRTCISHVMFCLLSTCLSSPFLLHLLLLLLLQL
jgi:hypothetical protein